MTFEQFLQNADWKRGESREMISGGNWHDPVTGDVHWNIHEPIRIQSKREAERLLIVLENYEPDQRAALVDMFRPST